MIDREMLLGRFNCSGAGLPTCDRENNTHIKTGLGLRHLAHALRLAVPELNGQHDVVGGAIRAEDTPAVSGQGLGGAGAGRRAAGCTAPAVVLALEHGEGRGALCQGHDDRGNKRGFVL